MFYILGSCAPEDCKNRRTKRTKPCTAFLNMRAAEGKFACCPVDASHRAAIHRPNSMRHRVDMHCLLWCYHKILFRQRRRWIGGAWCKSYGNSFESRQLKGTQKRIPKHSGHLKMQSHMSQTRFSVPTWQKDKTYAVSGYPTLTIFKISNNNKPSCTNTNVSRNIFR